MMETLMKAMKTSISEVLETMLYLAIEFDDAISLKESKILEEDVVTCSLGFRGGFNGNFLIFVPEDLAMFMAESFIGVDREDISQEFLQGTVKEIINMIAGNTFGAFDENVDFDLDIPEIVNIPDISGLVKNITTDNFMLVETTEGFLGISVLIKV